MKILWLWLSVILFLLQYQIVFSLYNSYDTIINPLCREDQRQLLLQLKQQLRHSEFYFVLCPRYTDPYHKTMLWNKSSNCCVWDGVTCDQSGRVIGLDLSCGRLTGEIHSNSSLFRLTHLRKLNLACNYFEGSEISPSSKISSNFGQLDSLTQLNLSNTYFEGPIPESIGNLTEVTEIDLSNNEFSGQVPSTIYNLRQLTFLDLSSNFLEGPIPESIGNLTEVTKIDLSGNEFSGQVPSTISNLRQLTFLGLSYNLLEGQIPDAFSDLQKLTALDLSTNCFEGPIPASLTNMSQLESLVISSNKLTGPFPSRAGYGLQQLSDMDLSNNFIQGTMPSWLLSLPSLFNLDLSFNQLDGQIRRFNCWRLQHLDLSNNKLNIELESFFNLSDIVDLRISDNTVTEHASKIVNVTLPSLDIVELSSCEIKEFPKLLRNSTSLEWLDLSNNTIQGPIPSWFSSLQGLQFLKISNNDLTYGAGGYEPWQQFQELRYLNLRSNSFQGTFPSSTCNMSRLQILNLSDNKFRGKIPECIGNSSSELLVLGLNGNQLEGPLPRSLANCSAMEILDLGNNKIQDTFPWWLQSLVELEILILRSNGFHGSITSSFSNKSFHELKVIDLSHDNFTGLLPEEVFGRLQAMKSQDQLPRKFFRRPGMEAKDWAMPKVSVSRSGWSGQGDQYTLTLTVKGSDLEFRVSSIFTAIDLSHNNFRGHIPESLAYLYSLQLLNLSYNNINGSIPPSLGYLTNLEHLDLSSNQLTGRIPQTLTNITFLEVLNLSHNHLAGPIPEGHQFSTFSSGSFDGNSGLCGAPLIKKCGPDEIPPSPVVFQEEEEDDSGFMMGFTWQAVVMGYGCGVVLGFILGNVMISIGKPKWFARFYYMEAAICLNRCKKRGRLVQGRR